MKRFMTLCLALIMTVSMTACGGQTPDPVRGSAVLLQRLRERCADLAGYPGSIRYETKEMAHCTAHGGGGLAAQDEAVMGWLFDW
jgi:hypothetical protein